MAPAGVPDFFINSFRIPPFLLPIYQAAGIEYDVPWPVLAAINEVETDYGRNLSVSTAGAVGWMQFLPSTWKRYGLDATASGYADPYNPVDAIFAAARYLHAAGASRDLSRAVFAYNHADWYVQSVLLRARLIEGIPNGMVDALAGLVEGRFPVAAPAKFADGDPTRLARAHVTRANPAVTVGSSATATASTIFARGGAPVIAVNDGTIVRLGQSQRLGRYVVLKDATGNLYTYAQLGSIARLYPVPKPPAQAAPPAASAAALAPTAPASAGIQSTPRPVRPSPKSPTSDPGPAMVKERLFAYPWRAASYAAGGALQLHRSALTLASFQDYFSGVLHLARDQYTLSPLRAGASVIAGTILGRVGAPPDAGRSHLVFKLRPAGPAAPYIDPKPILDGWRLLAATAMYRAQGSNPFLGKAPSVGETLLMSKNQLERRVLADVHVHLAGCERRQITAGLVDRRVLGALEFLSVSGLDPTVSATACARAATSSVEITSLAGVAVRGHQGSGSITDLAIRRLLTLQGTFKPDQITSLMQYQGQPNTHAAADHAGEVQISYAAQSGGDLGLTGQALGSAEWKALIGRISQIPEPVVPIAPSRYAIKQTAQ